MLDDLAEDNHARADTFIDSLDLKITEFRISAYILPKPLTRSAF
ncbi:MAG: hypothetical protein WCK32_10085 [Chlorobiaceae bacterium]